MFYLFLMGCTYYSYNLYKKYFKIDFKCIVCYLIVNLISIIYYKFNNKLDSVFFHIVIIHLLLSFIIDIKEMWIADYTIISVLIINIIRTIFNFYYNHETIYAGTIFMVLFILIVLLSQLILKKELMGFGDLKLFFVLSFNYSFVNAISLLMFSALIGIIYYFIFNKKNEFPFGPAIIIAYIAIEILKS